MGSWRDSLLRNSFHIMLTTAGNSVLGYLYWVLAAHLLPKASVGLGSALVSGMILCSIIGTIGIPSTLIERLSSRASGRDWNLTVTCGLLMGAVCGALCAGVGIVLFPAVSSSFDILLSSPLALMLFLSGTVCFTLSNVLDSVFIAERSSGGMSFRNITFGVVKLGLIAIPTGSVSAIVPLFSSWVVAVTLTLALTMAVLMPRLRAGVRPVLRGLRDEARQMSKSMWGHHATNLGGLLPVYLLPILVVAQLSPTDNAYFYLTWMLGSIFFFISPSVSSSLFAEGSHDITYFAAQIRRSGKFVLLLLAGPALFCIVFGQFVLRIFSPQFPSHAYGLLVCLAVSAVPDAVTNIAVSVLRVQRRLTLAALLNTGMAVFALICTWFFLPPLGITGAGLAWLLAQTVGATIVGVAAVRARMRAAAASSRHPANA